MTKVIKIMRRSLLYVLLLLMGVGFIYPAAGDAPPEKPSEMGPARKLYQELSSVGLDPARVFRIRGASLDRASLHITLDDGTIAFTQDVAGHVTGAFFQGEGEALLIPPGQVERGSMVLFTGGAILEEQFETAYFRFNDNTFSELQSSLRPDDDAQAFYSKWNETAKDMTETDALRLFTTFSEMLPDASHPGEAPAQLSSDDRFLHAHLQGRKFGGFDIYYDSKTREQIWAGQLRTVKEQNFYDVWTSFPVSAPSRTEQAVSSTTGQAGPPDAVQISDYQIRAEVKPPTEINAEASLKLHVLHGGTRTLLFELSRFLQVKKVEADGQPVEFIHNESLEGTQLSRRGNDVVAVVFPAPLKTGAEMNVVFSYGGEVISQAGPGLLYVGERGNWYPNLGIAMANFDLQFRYPQGWTLLATGKQVTAEDTKAAGRGVGEREQVSRWVSERAIPFAGFNLGKYARGDASAHGVSIQAYATNVVEKNFPKSQQPAVLPLPPGFGKRMPEVIPLTLAPSPAKNVRNVAENAAQAVDFFSTLFGAYPFSDLKITQLPGHASQGWPGMIFLSTYAYLTDAEKAQIQYTPVERTMINMTVAHETAHQWWGDLVAWNGYRDQWLIEALANYSSMLLLKDRDPAQFRAVLDKYRDDLLVKQEDGDPLMDAGPVTLGMRLSSSKFPSGYEAISYGRGTWLFFMLHSMIKDGEQLGGSHHPQSAAKEDLFLQTLHRIRDQYAGKNIATRELLKAFEPDMPASLRYEGKPSLDWFYDSWVNGTAIPRFELAKVKFSEVNGRTMVAGTIAEKDAPDNLVTLVPVYSLLPRKVLLGQVFVDDHEVQFRLTAPAGTRKVVLDPEHTLLTRPQ
jgi:hypothetical protein